MKSTPLIMSGPMMRAYLDGRKTQTRRTRGLNYINEEPNSWMYIPAPIVDDNRNAVYVFRHIAEGYDKMVKSSFGGHGDDLWFKEAWAMNESGDIAYQADGSEPENGDEYIWKPTWKSPLFMPHRASRANHVPLVSVRPERLQDITEADAVAEGFKTTKQWTARDMFLAFIFNLHPAWPPGFNPWVWRIEFKDRRED